MEFDKAWVLQYTFEKWPLIRAEMERVLPRSGPYAKWLNEPAWYHIGDDSVDPKDEMKKNAPKRSRPMFGLLAAECLGVPLKDSLPFAAATEITHNYLIGHDDVMDGDASRRDLPAVWVRYGKMHEKEPGGYDLVIRKGFRLGDVGIANGINLGDYMMAKAYEVVTTSHLPVDKRLALCDVLTTTLAKTGEGQALDINLRADPDFTVAKYHELAMLKTGYYLIFGVVGSAILAGFDTHSVDTLWKLGGNVGVAFQIIDDGIDLTSGKGRKDAKGRPELGNDIKEGKPSALFAKVLERADPTEKSRLIEIFRKPREKTKKGDVRWVAQLYKKHDVLQWKKVGGKPKLTGGWAAEEADRLIKEGIALVDQIKGFGDPAQAEKFKSLMRFMARRDT
jgi:geranylgeranyl diphosphate synthase type I